MPDQTEFTEMDFIEPSFEEIWQDYQQTHQDNDENYKDFFQ